MVRYLTLANKLKHFGPRTVYPNVMGDGSKAIKQLVKDVLSLETELSQAREQIARIEAERKVSA